MKGLSRNLVLVGIVLLSFTLLSACATSSKDSAADPASAEAVPGVYKNEAQGFTFTYPESFKVLPLEKDREVLRVAYPNEWLLPNIVIAVSDVSNEGLDPQVLMDAIKEDYPGAKRFKVLSEKDMTTNDGRPAKSFSFKWTWSDGVSKLQTAAFLTNKGEAGIVCTSTTGLGSEPTPDVLQAMCEAFKFD
jgi:hypothetical protein